MNKKFVSEEMTDEEVENLENVARKKEKKKKSKEEKGRDRKAVFWVMLFVIIFTISFWLKAYFEGKVDTGEVNEENIKVEEKGEVEEKEESGFFVRYKI